MITITNKTQEELNILVTEYQSLLFKKIEQFPQQAYIINSTKDYINEKYPDLTSYWKSLISLLVMKRFETINNETDIYIIIDGFVEYHKNQHQKYIDDIVMYVDEFERDYIFIKMYIDFLNNGSKPLNNTIL